MPSCYVRITRISRYAGVSGELLHAVPKSNRVLGERINLTFRLHVNGVRRS